MTTPTDSPVPTGRRAQLSTAVAKSFRGHGVLLRFSAASTLNSVITMLASFVIMRWVDPEHLGLWQSLLLIQTYATIAQLGVFNGLNRELPYRLGKGDSTAVEFVSAGQAFAYSVVGLLTVGAFISIIPSNDPQVRYVLPAVFLSSGCHIYMQFLGATYRASRSFRKLTIIYLVEATAGVATLPLVYFLHYPGLPLRYLALGAIALTVRHRWRPYPVKSRFDLKKLGTLLAVGLPLYALAYLLSISSTLPQVILLSQGSVEMVGIYAPAAAMTTLMTMVPGSIAQYVYPHMSHRLGATGDPGSLWPIAWRSSLVFMAFSVPVLLILVFLFPPMIEAFLPKYVPAIPAIKWTLISGFFLGSSISISALNSLKAWFWMSVYVGSRLAMSAALPFGFFHVFSDHVEGVACGYAITQAVSFVIALTCIRRATRRGGER